MRRNERPAGGQPRRDDRTAGAGARRHRGLPGRPAWRRAWRGMAAAGLAITALAVTAQAAAPGSAARVAGGPGPSARLTAASHPAAGAAAGNHRTARAPRPRAVVSFTFDDGDADVTAAARILHAHRMQGTFYIITGAVGTPGYLTLPQLRQLAAAGNEIGGHTVSHLDLTRLPAAETRRQVCQGRETLAHWGFGVTSFAYPGAFTNPAVASIVRGCGFGNARITGGLHEPGHPGGAPAEAMPPVRRYVIRAPGQVDGTWTLADLKQAVVTAERHGGWVPLVFHHVCTTEHCPPLSVKAPLLAEFTSWLARQRAAGVTVRTVGDMAGGPARPAVMARPARPHGVVNASMSSVGPSAAVDPALESVGTPGTFLRCWKPGGFGNNAATWRRTPDAHSGRWALRLQVTHHASGDAKLLQQFDLGACSLPVTAGRSYRLATWYRGTTPAQYSVYYRDRVGRWRYWASSKSFQPATTWTKAEWATPPVPAGATGVSFGLGVAANGTLVTDDYSFTEAGPGLARPIWNWSLLALALAAAGTWGARRIARRRRGRGRGGQPPPGPAPGDGSPEAPAARQRAG